LIIGGAGLAVAATETLLVSSNVRPELFIILSPGKGSQEREKRKSIREEQRKAHPRLAGEALHERHTDVKALGRHTKSVSI
jgi:hypothetical protein